MKRNLKSALPAALLAGTFALALGGCGTMNSSDRGMDRDRSADRANDRNMNRSVDSAAYGDRMSTNTPAGMDPFSNGYASFPASANESAGITGHSFYCIQHYSQPGCQTFDGASRDGRMWSDRNTRRGDARDSRNPTGANETAGPVGGRN